MFKDYYKILNISPYSSQEETKHAYRQMSLKWHPDRNQSQNTTRIMQDINEAYCILRNDESHRRYDNEYREFSRQRDYSEANRQGEKFKYWYYEHEIHNEDLKHDINEAREYARKIVDEFLKGFRESSKAAAKGAWDGALGYIIVGIMGIILFLIIRACN